MRCSRPLCRHTHTERVNRQRRMTRRQSSPSLGLVLRAPLEFGAWSRVLVATTHMTDVVPDTPQRPPEPSPTMPGRAKSKAAQRRAFKKAGNKASLFLDPDGSSILRDGVTGVLQPAWSAAIPHAQRATTLNAEREERRLQANERLWQQEKEMWLEETGGAEHETTTRTLADFFVTQPNATFGDAAALSASSAKIAQMLACYVKMRPDPAKASDLMSLHGVTRDALLSFICMEPEVPPSASASDTEPSANPEAQATTLLSAALELNSELAQV